MYTVEVMPTFRKNYKKLIKKDPSLTTRIDKTIAVLETDPFNKSIRSHKVGDDIEFGAIWSSRVTGDIRILWVIDSSKRLTLLLVKIGGHDYVY